MSSALGNKIRVQLFGQSHSEGLGVVIDGLPAGVKIDLDRINEFLEKRAGGRNPWSTKRAEPDTPGIISGMAEGLTCGAPLCAIFENRDIRGKDYEPLKTVPRPSHADYTAFVKHGGYNDASGGGHFSGRLTLPLCFAGAVCLQLLEVKNIQIDAHILAIGHIKDDSFPESRPGTAPEAHPESPGCPSPLPGALHNDDIERFRTISPETRPSPSEEAIYSRSFPTLNPEAGRQMIELVEAASAEGDSLGGIVECCAWGLPPGLGEPIFDNIESRLAYSIFAIPGVKGVEFGNGFGSAGMKGSEYNDPFYYDRSEVKTLTNHSGGILGGITNGMPLLFRAAFKPTPSISKEQKSVDLATKEEVTLSVKGRHDPCIAIRAVPCVIAAAAIVLYDIMLESGR